MDLALKLEPAPKSELWSISERVGASYRGKTEKTVTRDVNLLTRMGLLVRTKEGYVANLSVLDAFLPPRRFTD